MRRQDLLAEAVLLSRALLARYLPGFDGSNRTRQAPGLPNHLAWNLGHLALTMHRVADRLDGQGALPADVFIEGSDRGDASRFGTESIAFKSQPTDDPSRYPGYARCLEVFDGACARLAAAFLGAPDAALDASMPWGQVEVPVWAAVQRMVFHNGVHTGQIADLRRALDMGRVLG
jgi:hypothetical protein